MHEAEDAARQVSLQTIELQVRQADDLRPAIEAARQNAQALFVASDAFLGDNRVLINQLALDARLPTVPGKGCPRRQQLGPNDITTLIGGQLR